ncbi:hypothetical protein vseg_021262 [Gypsophila vaccaria]
MAKKKNWWLTTLLKNLFTCDSHSKTHKAETKGWNWFFDMFKLKKQLTSPASTCNQKSLSEAKEEQRKHVLNVAKATAAAAEAAMAAAQAAVEVVRLTGASRPRLKEFWNLAATKIQAAFRAYLARKALRALKGVVRIQALARGRAVRRQVSKEVKHSPSIHGSREIEQDNQSSRISYEVVEGSKLVECKSQRQWTDSLLSKEELRTVYLKKHEAAFRRERMRQYSFSHRETRCCQMLEDTVPLRIRKKWEDENTSICELGGNLRISARNLFKEDLSEEVIRSPSSYPRRSFCDIRKHKSSEDEECSLSYPTYMASTESTKAKMRSMSTPRQLRHYEGYETPYSTTRSYQLSSSKTSTSLW